MFLGISVRNNRTWSAFVNIVGIFGGHSLKGLFTLYFPDFTHLVGHSFDGFRNLTFV